MNEKAFRESMAYMSNLYGHKPDKTVLKMYWNKFKDYSDDKWLKMVNSVINTFTPTAQVKFPLPPHFLQAIGEDTDNLAQNAFKALQEAIFKAGAYSTVCFGDKALHAVIQRYGGWIQICSWSYDDWRLKERQFLEAYKSAKASNENGPEVLYGIIDTQNNANGYDNKEPIKLFWKADKVPLIEEKKNEASALIENLSEKYSF